MPLLYISSLVMSGIAEAILVDQRTCPGPAWARIVGFFWWLVRNTHGNESVAFAAADAVLLVLSCAAGLARATIRAPAGFSPPMLSYAMR